MKLVAARPSDSERLKTFFESVHLPGAIDFSFRRHGDFFDQYRMLSSDFETWMLIDEQGDLAGVGSLVFQEGHVLGKKRVWGYATDLRIKPSRKAVLEWAQHFLPVLESACENRNCRLVLSALELHDNKAYNALVRPTSHARRSLPRYHLANRFSLVSIHGRIPFSLRPLESIRLHELTVSRVEALCAYLRLNAKARPLSSLHTPDEFLARVANTPGLTLGDFRVAYDSQDRIIGCAALWDGSRVKEWIPQTYNGFAHTLHQSLVLAGRFGLVRPSSQPLVPMPVHFLSHICCDGPEVFHRLADDAFSRLKPKEFLSYLHFAGHWRTLPPHSYLATAVPFGLYIVLTPNSEAPVWPTPDMSVLPPEFEPGWL
jgi:hypothetical protein